MGLVKKLGKEANVKVAIYCRVSTDKQELDQQIAACYRFCEFKQFEVGGVFSEIGTGKNFNRAQFQSLLPRLRIREFDALVCFRFDRVGRNAREVAMFFEEMEQKGIAIFSINENLDITTPIGRAMRDIILRLAQLERENISEATKHRLQALKNMGKKIGRPAGSKDKGRRKKTGYLLRWAKKGGTKSALL